MSAAARVHAAAATRAYVSPRRRLQAAQTRTAILEAAAQLFSARGWSATGMRDVAQAAEVAIETVYANFRSKADLLKAVLDVAIVGDPEPVPLADRPEFAALRHGTFDDRARAAAGLVTRIHARTVGIHTALRQAAASEPALADFLTADEERRRLTVQQGIELVAQRPPTEAERDGLWAVFSIEVYRLLVERSGWTPAQYEAWLGTVITRLLEHHGKDHP